MKKKRLSRRAKTVLTLALASIPLLWLLFTQAGQRRIERVLLPLFGRPNVELSLTDLSSKLHEPDIRARLPELDLQCLQGETPFGDRACTARIGSFDGLPAEALAFYFSAGELRGAKLTYRRDVHGELLAFLTRRLGEGVTTKRGAAEVLAGFVSWPVVEGVVLLNAGDLAPGEDPALLWLSNAAVEQRARAPVRP